MNASQLINQTSGKVSYGTPSAIVEAARATMGGIDLDPASSHLFNLTVKAERIYTADEDGLSKVWAGRIWLNHPFSRQNNPKWIPYLQAHYEGGLIDQACCICYACTSEAWFQPLYDYPLCFLSPRTDYFTESGQIVDGVTKGSVVAYFGRNTRSFVRNFSPFGRVMIPIV